MGSRLTQMLDSESSTGKELLKIYKDLGIAVFDTNGQIRSSYDIWSDLAKVWGTLDKNTQNYISLTSSGANQIQNFSALMKNFSNAASATETAINSTGSAVKENAKYMESLEAKTNAVKATFQDLSTSLISDDLVGTILDIANGFLQLVDTDVGRILAIGTALTVVTFAASSLWKVMDIGGKFASFISVGGGGIAAGLGAINLPLMAILATVTALVAFSPQIKEFFNNLADPIGNATKKIEENNTQLEANKTKLEELEKTPWYDRTEDINNEIEKLKELNTELEKSNEKYQKQKAKAASGIISGEKQQIVSSGYTIRGGKNFGYSAAATDLSAALEKVSVATCNTIKTIKEAKEEGYYLTETFNQITVSADDFYKNTQQRMAELNAQMKKGIPLNAEQSAEWSKLKTSLEEYVASADDYIETGGVLDTTQLRLYNSSKILLDQSDNLAQTFKTQGEAATIASNGLIVTKEQANALTAADSSLADSISNVNGVLYVQESSLYALAEAGNETARQRIKDEKQTTENVIAEIKKRITAYQAEADALLTYLYAKVQSGVLSDVQAEKFYGQHSSTRAVASAKKELKGQLAKLDSLNTEISSWIPAISLGVGAGNGGSTAKSKSTSSDTKTDVLEAIKTTLSQAEHEIFLLTKHDAQANAEEIIKIYQSMQDSVNAKAQELRKQGYAENSKEIIELQQLWWGYSDKIKDVYDSIEENHKQMLENIGKELDKSLQTQIDKYKKLADEQSNIQSQAESDAEVYKKYASIMADYIDGQISGYQKEIDALEEANSEREKQIAFEEKINNLAKAKATQVMVYKDGKFQYTNDIDEISAAQSDLQKYEREQNLEKEKQYWQDKIDNLEKYKAQWDDFTNEYQSNADLQELTQSGLFSTEDLIFSKRITNADSFATKYEAAMKKAQDALAKMLEYEQKSAGLEAIQSGIGTSGADWSQVWWDAENAYNSGSLTKDQADAIKDYAHQMKTQEMAGTGSTFNSGTGTWSGSTSTSSPTTSSSSGKGVTGKNPAIYGRANGTLSDEGGIKLVGEKGPEIRVLNQGDGVIPADVTKNLWSFGTNPYAYLTNAYNALSGSKTSGDTTYKFDIARLELPDVSNPSSFVNGLKNLAYQYSAKRK